MRTTQTVSKITIKDALLYSPYDNNKRKLLLDEKDFDDIRIVPDSYHDEKMNLLNQINPEGNFDSQLSIISGYSGNGKTTFLYWFQEQIAKDEYWFDITNLIDQGHGTVDDFALVQKSIIHKYNKEAVKKLTLDFIWKHQIVFSEFFALETIEEIANLNCDHNYNAIKCLAFLRKLDFDQLLIVYLLDNILNFINDEKYRNTKSFTFCFDNLDELRFEYMTPIMWNAILDISSHMTYIVQNTNLEFEYTKRVYFVLVFREANIACGTAQLNDRLSPSLNYKKFIYTNMAKEIIEKRLELVDDNLNEDALRLKYLIDIIINDKTLGYIYLPLFNYDYRKLCEAVIDCVRPDYIDGNAYRLFTMLPKEYESISKEYKHLKRGILQNVFIRYFARENYLDKLAPVRNGANKNTLHCNKARLMLTVFSNLSFPNGFPTELKELGEIKPCPFSLLTAFRECSVFFDDIDDFLSHLGKLINLDKSSWAHLVTVYGKEPKREGKSYYFDFRSEKILITKYLTGGKISEKEQLRLDNLSISLNASAYVYLRHILPHFEYISGYKTKSNSKGWYHQKPLLFMTDITVVDKNICWEFEEQIKSVYEQVELYTNNNLNYFKSIFYHDNLKKGMEEFCRSKMVFKGEYHSSLLQDSRKRYSFYSSRMISTHINYLEKFRKYITNSGFAKLEAEMNRDDRGMPTLSNKGKIHKFILDYCNKYIELLEDFDDPAIRGVTERLREAYKMAIVNNKLEVSVDGNSERPA